MPKKTKREKVLAERHRKLETTYSSYPDNTPNQKSIPDSYTLPTVHTLPVTPVKQPESDNHYNDIRSDLKKTLMLATTAIGIELLLYWKIR